MADTGTIGWKGYMKLSSTEVGTKLLPFTTEDLTENIEAIQNDGIHGGGISELDGVFGSRHNIAIGGANYAGNINGDVFGGTGQYADAFRILLDASIGRSSGNHLRRLEGFTESNPIVVSPTGETAYQYPSVTVENARTGATETLTTPVKAVVNTMALSGNMGGNVTYGANVMATSRRIVTGVKPTTADFSYEAVSNLDDSNPVPYWSSEFDLTGSGETFGGSGSYAIKDMINDWNINIDNSSQAVRTFNGNNVATDMVQGIMKVTGSMSYYSPTGVFDPKLNNGATLTLTLGTLVIKCPYLFFTTLPVPNPGMDGVIYRSVEFEAIAADNLASIYISA